MEIIGFLILAAVVGSFMDKTIKLLKEIRDKDNS